MKKVLSLMVILFLIFTLNALAQGNNYFIKVKLSEDMKEASGIMKIDYINTNTFNLEEIYFRLISQLCQIKKVTDIDGNELSYEFSENYFGEIKVKLKRPLESKKSLAYCCILPRLLIGVRPIFMATCNGSGIRKQYHIAKGNCSLFSMR
jgi:hypothetical protein